MSFPRKFERMVWSDIKMHIVWPPGNSLKCGDIVKKDGGIFRKVSHIRLDRTTKEMSLEPIRIRKEATNRLLFDSQGRRLKSFSPSSNAIGRLKVNFSTTRDYFVSGEGGERISLIKDPLFFSSRIAGNVKGWEYLNWFIVYQIFIPQNFTVLGSTKRFHKLSLEGPQRLLAQFQKTGFLDPRVEASGDSGKIIEFKSTPKGGPLLFSAFRVKRNGKPDF